MKRPLQFVALAIAALLAVQPALAAMTCAQQICGTGPTSTNCCLSSNGMSMPAMSDHTSMMLMDHSEQASQQSIQAELSCGSGPCCTVSSFTTPKLVPSDEVRVSGVASFAPLGGFSSLPTPVRAVDTVGAEDASAPARYVLFQVFRI